MDKLDLWASFFGPYDQGKANCKRPVKQETIFFIGLVIWLERITNSTSRRSWNVLSAPLLVSVEELRVVLPAAGENTSWPQEYK